MNDILKRVIIILMLLAVVCCAIYFTNAHLSKKKESRQNIEESNFLKEEEKVELPTDEVETFNDTVAQTITNLNFRDEASENGKVIEVIPNDSNVEVKAKIRNGWYKVSYNNNTGYVSGEYIKILTQEEKKEITIEENYDKETYAISDNGVNIRQKANENSQIITTMKSGSILRLYSKMQNGWYKVEGNAKEGYASGEYIRVLTENEYNALSEGNKFLDSSNNIIATYTATSGYGQSSRYNMHVAADYMNGTIVKSGQTYSHIATIFPENVENKYVDSYVQVNGKLEMGNAGGVCMSSSVLHAAIASATEKGINTGLVIGQRSPHSNPVHYVPVKYEATIASPTLDFSFRNINPYSIKIETKYNYNTLTVTIYKI